MSLETQDEAGRAPKPPCCRNVAASRRGARSRWTPPVLPGPTGALLAASPCRDGTGPWARGTWERRGGHGREMPPVPPVPRARPGGTCGAVAAAAPPPYGTSLCSCLDSFSTWRGQRDGIGFCHRPSLPGL